MKDNKESLREIVEEVEDLQNKMEQITKELADDEAVNYALQNMTQSLRNFVTYSSWLPSNQK